MGKGKTKSKLTLSERREQASELFAKGFNVSDVARRLKVSWETAAAYKRWHEERIESAATENPQLLQDVLKNTIASIAELDQIRKEAWRTYHTAESKQIKLQALNTIRSAQQDKAKLFGLFGVKQDFYVHVQNVTVVQNKILDFLSRELCEADRRKLEAFLITPELQRYMGQSQGMPILEIGEEETEEIDLSA